MKMNHAWRKSMLAVGCAVLILAANGCRPKSSAAVPGNLIGTWRIASVEGHNTGSIGDLTFTISTNGGYVSQITIPDAHSIKGFASVENGIMIVTITNRDNTAAGPGYTQHNTIVRCDGDELVIRPEGSDMPIHFRKLVRTREGP
jgi:hypothetical protein